MEPFALFQTGPLPIYAVAVHNGHALLTEVAQRLAVDDATRLREEDQYTGHWAEMFPSHAIVLHSRFQVDLNRPRESAIYKTPEQAWGLQVWQEPVPEPLELRLLELYDHFYELLEKALLAKVREYGCAAVLDLHTYNHRRAGPWGPPAESRDYPEINIGTGTMDRPHWSTLIDRFCENLTQYDFAGRHLDVRENVCFFGGEIPRWIHTRFPGSVCALAIEVKKFFMDEWTGRLSGPQFGLLGDALRSTVPGLLRELKERSRGCAA